jgi:hypothetical protein
MKRMMKRMKGLTMVTWTTTSWPERWKRSGDSCWAGISLCIYSNFFSVIIIHFESFFLFLLCTVLLSAAAFYCRYNCSSSCITYSGLWFTGLKHTYLAIKSDLRFNLARCAVPSCFRQSRLLARLSIARLYLMRL